MKPTPVFKLAAIFTAMAEVTTATNDIIGY